MSAPTPDLKPHVPPPPPDTEACGCCDGIAAETPQGLDNRPGLSAFAYRIGDHAQFRASVHASLSLQKFTPSGAICARATTTTLVSASSTPSPAPPTCSRSIRSASPTILSTHGASSGSRCRSWASSSATACDPAWRRKPRSPLRWKRPRRRRQRCRPSRVISSPDYRDSLDSRRRAGGAERARPRRETADLRDRRAAGGRARRLERNTAMDERTACPGRRRHRSLARRHRPQSQARRCAAVRRQ